MKKIHLLTVFTFLLLLLTITAAGHTEAATNVIRNGGFDNGLNEWVLNPTLSVTSSWPLQGDAVKVNLHPLSGGNFTGTVISQNLNVTGISGKIFTISMNLTKYYNPPGNTIAVYLTYLDNASASQKVKIVGPANTAITTDTPITATYTFGDVSKLTMIEIAKEAYGEFLVDDIVLSADGITVNLPDAAPATISFTGSAKDTAGNAVAGAVIFKAGDPGMQTTSVTTGDFTLPGLPSGSLFSIRVAQQGFVPVFSSNFESASNITAQRPFKLFTPQEIVSWGIQTGKSVINGVVADNTDPLATTLSGATLTATGNGGKSYTVTYEDTPYHFGGTATSGNGHFYVLNVDDLDTVTVSVTLPGYTFTQNQRTFVTHTGAMSEGSFFGTSTGPTYSISGSVKNSSTNQGIQDAAVTIKNGANTVVKTVTTDTAGHYSAIVSAAGDYYASAAKTGYDDLTPPDKPIEITDISPNATFNILLAPGESPSVVATLSLTAGWNFISFLKDPSPNNTIAEVLKEVSANVRVVWGYNNQSKVWLKYSLKTQHSTLNTLDIVETGLGYWIYMNAAGTITMTNWAAPPTLITLYPGWNLAGYNGTNGAALATALAGISGTYAVIWNWNNGEWFAHRADGQTIPASDLTTAEQKRAYWIKTNLTTGQTANWQQ